MQRGWSGERLSTVDQAALVQAALVQAALVQAALVQAALVQAMSAEDPFLCSRQVDRNMPRRFGDRMGFRMSHPWAHLMQARPTSA
jgi:hypothetical protein